MMAPEGVIAAEVMRDLRFATTMAPPGKVISLERYVNRMPENQHDILHKTGGMQDVVKVFTKKGLEVLEAHPLDEAFLKKVTNYEGRKFVHIRDVKPGKGKGSAAG